MKNYAAIIALSFALAACLGGGGGSDGDGDGGTPSAPSTPSATQGISPPGSVSVVPAQD